MNEKIRFKGSVHWAVLGPIYMAVLFAVLNIGVYFFDITSGIVVSIFLVIYLLFVIVIFRRNRVAIYEEIECVGGYYTETQDGLLDQLKVPYVLLDAEGKILWMNHRFRDVTGKPTTYHKSIAGILPTLTREFLFKVEHEERIMIAYEGNVYRTIIRREKLPDYRGKYVDIITPEGGREVISVLMIDKTRQIEFERKYEEEKMAVGLVYLDNFDEVTERLEEVKGSLLKALVDRKISRYFSGKNVLVKRFDDEKYILLFKQSHLDEYKENKFSILESIKEIKVGNEMGVTLSIGIGAMGSDYQTNYEFARAAMDLALGRGGDQVVLKEDEQISYFGGKTRQLEKQTRVKARIKAQALYEVIQNSDNIIIMGHHIGDVDSFGASIGIYRAAATVGKRAHIVIDEVTSSIRPMKELFVVQNNYPEDMFLMPEEAIEMTHRETMVMVVDVNRPSYTECPELLERSDNVVVFDHHRHGSDSIQGAVLSYIEPYASSTCEMVTEILQYFSEEVQMTQQEADSIYAGIIIDTNNFMTKTGVRTFEAAAYLRRSGADVTRVRKMLQNDMEAYKARAETVRHAEVYLGEFAISTCPAGNVESPTVAGAQAANELLNIIGIKASFVLTEYQGKIYISSRSIDEIDVQAIMTRCGGGGHLNVAGAQLVDCNMEEAKARIRQILDEMIAEGEIKL